MADNIEIKIEESDEPPQCAYCGLDMDEEEYEEWRKENKNYGAYVCEKCDNLSHFEKTILMRLGFLHRAIMDVEERIMTKEDFEKEKTAKLGR